MKAATIPIPAKKGDIVFLEILQAYANSVSYTNAVSVSKHIWQNGTGSTFGWCEVIQASADNVTVTRGGSANPDVRYSIASTK